MVASRGLAALALVQAACGGPPAPAVEVPPARPARAEEEPTKAPTAILVPVAVDRTALLPDPDCHERPLAERHLLGYRPLPDAEIEATFFLVGDEGVCRVGTRARADLMLAASGRVEQTATCRAWRAPTCLELPLRAALPSPPFRSVERFDGSPDWRQLDIQSDELGQPRREQYTSSVRGTTFSLVHTRKGWVTLTSGGKNVDAFWAKAFVTVDGVPHLFTPDELVRLVDPLERLPLPSLYVSDHPPQPAAHPWGRGEN